MAQGLFVTSTGVAHGKTMVIRGMARSLVRRGVRVAAIKPIEMGCEPAPIDAEQLAATCVEPHLVDFADFYRAAARLSPLAATLEGAPPPPPVERIAARAREAVGGVPVALVEGVGTLATPIDREHLVADLAAEVGFSLLLVAKDQPGVVDDVLAHLALAQTRRLRVEAVVLTRHRGQGGDPTRPTNHRILAQRLAHPVRIFAQSPDDDDALADAAEAADLPALVS